MPRDGSAAAVPRSVVGLAASVALVGFACAQQSDAIPNFARDSRIGLIAGDPDGVNPVGQEFLPPPSGPGPVSFDPPHPYLDTRGA